MSRHGRTCLGLGAALAGLSACSELIGLDRFHASDGPGGARTVVNACGRDEVVTDDGKCAKVGVEAATCALPGLTAGPDGGCTIVLPKTECASGLAYPGVSACDPLFGSPSQCPGDGYPGAGDVDPSRVLHVDGAGSGSACAPRGSALCPYLTLSAAITGAASGTVILVRKGHYAEDVVLAAGLTLRACEGQVVLEGQSATAAVGYACRYLQSRPDLAPYERSAAVCVPPGVTDVVIEGLSITGPGDGVAVTGGAVTLRRVSIQGPSYFGVRARSVDLGQQSIAASNVTLDHAFVTGAHGAGVWVSGSTLTVTQSSIQDTVPLDRAPLTATTSPTAAMGLARGISAGPSGWTQDGQTGPGSFAPSTVTIQQSAITGHPQIGLYAAGANVTVDRTFIGALEQGTPSGRGLVAERSSAAGVPTTVQVTNSVFERNRDAAIDVRDATVEVDDTTIDDTAARVEDGCSGQGLRIRSFPPGDARSQVTVKRSTILRSRQAAILAASSTVSVEDTLIRGIAPDGDEGACIQAMGDGVALEDLPDQLPVDAHLDHVRIDDAARAAIFYPGGRPSLASTLLACSQKYLTVAGGFSGSPAGAVCGCDTHWATCTPVDAALDTWITSGPSASWPDATAVWSTCIREFSLVPFSGTPIAGAAFYSYDRPEVAPAQSRADGCFRLGGLRDGPEAPGFLKPGFNSLIRTEGRFSGFSFTPGTLSAVFTDRGWPVDLPAIYLSSVPTGALLVVDPPAALSDAAGNVFQGPVGPAGAAVTVVVAPEPGWYSIRIQPPSGTTCDVTTVADRAQAGVIATDGFGCHTP